MRSAVLIWLAAVVTHAILVAYPATWYRFGIPARMHHVLSSAPGCRVLLVGSSPMIFGVSAAELQSATGCASVNLGALAVAHQLNDYLSDVLRLAQAGDIVVLSDRLWLTPGIQSQPCDDGPVWQCVLPRLTLVPNINEDWVLLRGFRLARSKQGDLLDFPMLPPERGSTTGSLAGNADYRIARLVAQVEAIRARGALPVLAAAPVLVTPQNRADVELAAQQLGLLVEQRYGPGVWLSPPIDTTVGGTTLDGQHATPLGRRRWTAMIVAAVGRPR